MLRIYDLILAIVKELKAHVQAIARHDPDLARQMNRAMTSVALNVAEGSYSRGRNRGARYHDAMGSMNETLACVDVGHALGYCPPLPHELRENVRRVIGTLVKVTR